VATSPELSAGGEPDLAAAPVPAGATVGVEEEFHLVDPTTLALAPSPELSEAALRGEFGGRIHAEITTTQLETVTGICRTLADVRDEITGARLEAIAAAESAGVAMLAASTHPFGSWQQQQITHAPRYEAMVERWAALALPTWRPPWRSWTVRARTCPCCWP
jgi:gamma-glutamyl:cysteine ligase YbdK (ATP-grasp superfamily)